MDDATGWVCSNCRSINAERSGRCYSCRAPRALALDLAAAEPPVSIPQTAAPREQALLARKAGETYRSSALRAWFVRLSIGAVTVASLVASVVTTDWMARLTPDNAQQLLQELIGDAPLLLLPTAMWIVGWICWGAWLSRVVANTPALGGGWPRTSPAAAFASSVIPLYNLYGATSVLRDVMVRLAAPGTVRLGLLTAWWISVFLYALPAIGLIPGPTFVIRLVYNVLFSALQNLLISITGNPVTGATIQIGLSFANLLIAAVLTLLVVEHVEQLQADRRDVAGAPRLARA